MQERPNSDLRQRNPGKTSRPDHLCVHLPAQFDPNCRVIGVLVGCRPFGPYIAAEQSRSRHSGQQLPTEIPFIVLCINQFAHGFPLPVLRNANADQLGIGQEDVGRKSCVAVQEVAGNRGGVEYILVIEHHLPAVLVGENQRERFALV